MKGCENEWALMKMNETTWKPMKSVAVRSPLHSPRPYPGPVACGLPLRCLLFRP